MGITKIISTKAKLTSIINFQHKNLLSLKQQHELLDQEIQENIFQLNKTQQKRISLDGKSLIPIFIKLHVY